jgi:hypothetical protein
LCNVTLNPKKDILYRYLIPAKINKSRDTGDVRSPSAIHSILIYKTIYLKNNKFYLTSKVTF